MAISAAALVPHPPLLLPELGRSPTPDLELLRSASRRAVATLLDHTEALLVVGPAPAWGEAELGAAGSFVPYGAPVTASLPAAAAAPAVADGSAGPSRDADAARWLDRAALPPGHLTALPLSLAVAAWLLDQLAEERALPPVAAFGVPAGADAGQAAPLGRALAAAVREARVGLLVMADLSARRTQRAPASFHPDAEEFDRRIGDAIRKAELGRLREVDPALAAEMGAGGMAALWLLAGALADVRDLHGEVRYEGGPFGVGYLVGVLESR
jgi:aromatic ring-opening dioxygenase LigB subunit